MRCPAASPCAIGCSGGLDCATSSSRVTDRPLAVIRPFIRARSKIWFCVPCAEPHVQDTFVDGERHDVG